VQVGPSWGELQEHQPLYLQNDEPPDVVEMEDLPVDHELGWS